MGDRARSGGSGGGVVRTAAQGGDIGRHAGRAGGNRARFLCVPFILLKSVRAAGSRRRRRQWPQPVAAGSWPRFPPADALFRLCRNLDRFLLRGRGDGDARRRPSLCAGDAAMDFGGVDLPHPGHHGGQLLGLLRAWVGRLVVLGSGRECVADAVAGGDRAAPFGLRARDPRWPSRLDDHAVGGRFLDVDDRHVPGAIGHSYQRSFVRGGPDPGKFHPRASGDLYRRRLIAVRTAGRDDPRRRDL